MAKKNSHLRLLRKVGFEELGSKRLVLIVEEEAVGYQKTFGWVPSIGTETNHGRRINMRGKKKEKIIITRKKKIKKKKLKKK